MANIKVFARLKPCRNINQELFKREDQTLYISSRGQVGTNGISSRVAEESKCFRFRFSHVFGMDSSQKNVFEVAAKDIVETFLEGYNGTIFAYGQTGAGKTYTIQGPEGNLEDSRSASENAGLIPRSLSLIFHKLQHNQHDTINLHISFLEIYTETAYDLLGPLLFKGPRKFKELPKQVLITMGGKGACHLHGLSCHNVTSERDAVRLYHLGLANRKTAQTTANQRSSKSHTIFTISLTRQRHGAEVFIRSKLHLVDLAGSERVWKSTGKEQQLSEAKFVNLSLHHLESVIIALQKFSIRNFRNHNRKKQNANRSLNRSSSAILSGAKNMDGVQMHRMNALLKSLSAVELGNQKGRHSPVVIENESVHVPYRNSLLTMVLQDSLGGNSNAAMIATLSLEEKNFCETITTCRFAQRVARVINKPIRNEEVNKDLVIKRLQTTLAKLYLELATYKASEQESMMACCEDRNRLEHEQECVDVIDSYFDGRINDPVAHGINTPRKFRTTLRHLRRMFVQSSSPTAMSGDDGLESTDDRDSGVRTGSEPTSPLASEGENDRVHFSASYYVAQLPSSASIIANASEHSSSFTEESEISLKTDHEEATPDISLPCPSSDALQSCGPGTNEASTQTTVLTTTFQEGKRKKDACAEEERIQPVALSPADLWIWELELQKETLLNRSKMFTSRLTDQRARLVVMVKQGAVPEELENEKIVELQLQKKQREVENKLSLVIKKLADMKYTDRLQQSVVGIEKQTTESKEGWPLTCTARSSQGKDVTQTSKELELKEGSTRQKLLARREQMRNFGFSTPPMHHGMSCQSPASVSGFRAGTHQASFPATSTLPLRWKDHGREGRVQCSPNLPLDTRDIVVKPPRLKSRLSDNSLQMNNTVPNFHRAALRRTFLNQERLSKSAKCATSRSEGKRSPLSEHINNSRRAVYHNSTFPRQIGNGVQSDLSGLKNVRRKMPKKQGTSLKHDTGLSRSSGSGLQLNEELSAKEECGQTDLKEERDMRSATENQDNLCQEHKCSSYGNLHLLFSGEEATSKSREQVHSHESPSPIRLKKEQNERVKKIRECVNAAEVIQRTWRLYKKHESVKAVNSSLGLYQDSDKSNVTEC